MGQDKNDQDTMEIQKRSLGINNHLVFLSAVLVLVLIAGLNQVLSIFFVEIMDTFNSSRAETAVVQSTTIGVRLGSGIFNGAFIHRFGPAKAGFVGTSLVSLGLMASFFATSVTYMVISLGVLLGIGISMVTICSNVVVDERFSGKSRLVYLSILSTSSSIGGMIYPYVMGYLKNMYGFKGTLLIMGGIVLNGFVAALLWQPSMEKHNFKTKTEREKTAKEQICTNNTDISMASNTIHSSENGFTQHNENIIVTGLHHVKHDKHTTISSMEGFDNAIGKTIIHEIERNSNSETFNSQGNDSSMEKTKSFLTNEKNIKNSTWNIWKLLMRNNTFVTFGIALAFVNPAIKVFVIFIVDIFEDNGFGKSDYYIALILLNIFGILGRLSTGFCKKLRCVSTISLPIMASILGMASMVSMIFIQSLVPSLVVCCFVGVCNGILVAAFTVTSAKLVPTDHHSNAIGVLYTVNGIANAAAGPVNGLMRDMTGSYTIVLISAA